MWERLVCLECPMCGRVPFAGPIYVQGCPMCRLPHVRAAKQQVCLEHFPETETDRLFLFILYVVIQSPVIAFTANLKIMRQFC